MVHVDTIDLFQGMAQMMNDHPERYAPLGDVDLDLVCVMRGEHETERVRLVFDGIRCSVVPAVDGDEAAADCWLEGSVVAWREMFENIHAHGGATGLQTLNSLTLLGESIGLRGRDQMGIDKFSRFNQTLQEFFDGAASVKLASLA